MSTISSFSDTDTSSSIPTADRIGRYVQHTRDKASSCHEHNNDYMLRFETAYRSLTGMSLEDKTKSTLNTSSKFKEALSVLMSAKSAPETSPRPERSIEWGKGISESPSVSIDLSERPILCSSLSTDGKEVVIGGSDHGVYFVDPASRTLKNLFNRTYGHSEWVTAVAHLEDGWAVTGGMDSKLCLWGNTGKVCTDLIGHRGSISSISTLGNLILSSSYDKTLKIWDSRKAQEVVELRGHKAPILHLVRGGSGRVVTGDRGGSAFVWDISAGEKIWRLRNIHTGHITAVSWTALDSSVFMTGGQDGMLRIWDSKAKVNLVKKKVHGSLKDALAAINQILVAPFKPHLVLTSGADQTVKVFDKRNGFDEPLAEFDLPDFPYTAEAEGNLALFGCGDGSISVLDFNELQIKQTVDTNKGAVRCVHLIDSCLVSSGDDGHLNFFDIDQFSL